MSRDQTLQERLMQIAQASLEQTRSGQMSWRATDDEDAFLFSGSSTSLIVDAYPGLTKFELRVLNTRGTSIAELDGMYASSAPPHEGQNRVYDLLGSLHDAARRSALDIDVLLDSALADVESATEPPPSGGDPWSASNSEAPF